MGWARKLEQSKEIGVAKEFFVERGLFVVKKGSYTTFDTTFDTLKIHRDPEN